MALGVVRLKDRAMSQEESQALLLRCLVGRVGTVGDDGMPYVTPVNYVYDPRARRIYLHHSPNKEGHLLANLRHSNKVCVEVDERGPVAATGDYACDTTQVYQSVICFGCMSAIDDPAEKRRVMGLLVRKYIDGLMPGRTYNPEMVELGRTMVLALEIEVMTGKQRKPPASKEP